VIFTIGYGNRSFDTFTTLLRHYEVEVLFDIRSHPYSRHNPYYNKKVLSANLSAQGIDYYFLGEALGGRPTDLQFYTNGNLDYAKLTSSSGFNAAIHHIIEWVSIGKTLTILCSELRPENCHRAKLIAPALIGCGCQVLHIDEQGDLLSHDQVVMRWSSSTQPPLL
jgi:uncharacterized protein (DUF488 family)